MLGLSELLGEVGAGYDNLIIDNLDRADLRSRLSYFNGSGIKLYIRAKPNFFFDKSGFGVSPPDYKSARYSLLLHVSMN